MNDILNTKVHRTFVQRHVADIETTFVKFVVSTDFKTCSSLYLFVVLSFFLLYVSKLLLVHTYIHPHTHIYIYIYLNSPKNYLNLFIIDKLACIVDRHNHLNTVI